MNWAASIHQVAALTTMPALGDCQIGEGEIRLFSSSTHQVKDHRPFAFHPTSALATLRPRMDLSLRA